MGLGAGPSAGGGGEGGFDDVVAASALATSGGDVREVFLNTLVPPGVFAFDEGADVWAAEAVGAVDFGAVGGGIWNVAASACFSSGDGRCGSL